MRVIDLTQMRPGESGVVAEIHGGYGMARKVQGIGIRPGKEIIKTSSHFWHGPQTVKMGNIQVAVGFGMAKRIFVEVER